MATVESCVRWTNNTPDAMSGSTCSSALGYLLPNIKLIYLQFANKKEKYTQTGKSVYTIEGCICTLDGLLLYIIFFNLHNFGVYWSWSFGMIISVNLDYAYISCFPSAKNISFCVSSCKSHSTTKKLNQNKSCYYERFRYLSNLPVDWK